MRERGAREFVLVALAGLLLMGCDPIRTRVIANGNEALARAGGSEARVPIGDLFEHDEGPICVVLGAVDAVQFTAAVPQRFHESIVQQLDEGFDGYNGVKAHLFNEEGRRVGALDTHRREGLLVFNIDGEFGSPDVCFAPTDVVSVERGIFEPETIVIGDPEYSVQFPNPSR